MKKIFTLIAAATMAFGANAETVILSWTDATVGQYAVNGETDADNLLTWDNGFKMAITSRADKALSGANNITVDGENYKSIKLSNGAGNTLFAPEGYVITNLTIYDYINYNRESKGSDGRVCYWKEVAGTTYTEETATILKDYNDIADYGTTPDKVEFPINKLSEVTFTQTGEQLCVVFEVTYEEGTGSAETGALMSWDFTKWSDATVANLKAGANWSDIEKADATEPTEISKDKCFWQVSYAEGLNADKYLTANDVVIEELKGLVYTNEKANRSLAIAVDYPVADASKDFGPYHGPAYLWLGSKEINYFIIPGVPAGATIKMGVESHKLTDARGVKLSVAGETLNAPDGSAVAAPTTYVEQEWLVPATAAATNDVQITNTNGCHIYFITVTAASSSAIETIAADENAPVEYYNLQGVRVANPANGIFIKRQGNKVEKVLVK